MQVKINISLKTGVLDPQGRAVENALSGLGFTDASQVRIGKQITLDIDAEDSNGATPLMIASAAGNAPLVKLLLKKGAKVDAVDATGLSALELAMRGGYGECETALRNALDAVVTTGPEGLKDET